MPHPLPDFWTGADRHPYTLDEMADLQARFDADAQTRTGQPEARYPMTWVLPLTALAAIACWVAIWILVEWAVFD